MEPHTLPFQKKRRLFEKLAKDFGAPTAMQEAAVRNRLESAYGELKKVRKEMKKEAKEKERNAAKGSSTAAASKQSGKSKDGFLVEEIVKEKAPPWSTLWTEVETQALLWEAEGAESPWLKQIIEKAECCAEEEGKAVLEAKLVTGKLRVEYQWRSLNEEWRKAYEKPLIKAVKVYFDHDAIQGVSKDVVTTEDLELPVRADQQGRGDLSRGRAEGALDSRRAPGRGGGLVPDVGAYSEHPGSQHPEHRGRADGVGRAV